MKIKVGERLQLSEAKRERVEAVAAEGKSIEPRQLGHIDFRRKTRLAELIGKEVKLFNIHQITETKRELLEPVVPEIHVHNPWSHVFKKRKVTNHDPNTYNS